MNCPNSPRSDRISAGFSIELATGAEADELNAIYGSDDGFSGAVAVRYTREPNPYASLLAEGSELVLPVVREISSGRLIGMGACVIRAAWVNGEPIRVGYLTGLKALPEFRGWVRLIPQVYAFLRQMSPDVRCYHTTILSENLLARRMLEKPRRDMPGYRFVSGYHTHCFRMGGLARWRPGRPGARLRAGEVAELVEFNAGGRFNLTSAGVPPGIRDDDVRVLVDAAGRPRAWCAVLDQRSTKQYVITGYGGRYPRLARLPVHWLGYPRLPAVGQRARHVSIAALGALDDDPQWVVELLARVGREFVDQDFVLVGITDGHPFAGALAAIRSVEYSSRLYTVHFDKRCVGLDDRPIGLDVCYL